MGTFVKVAEKKDIPAGSAKAVEIKGNQVALFNLNGQYYAIDDTCTHAGGSLAEGSVDGNQVTCPWHGAIFDITNGKATGGPADEAVEKHNVIVEGEDIKIEE